MYNAVLALCLLFYLGIMVFLVRYITTPVKGVNINSGKIFRAPLAFIASGMIMAFSPVLMGYGLAILGFDLMRYELPGLFFQILGGILMSVGYCKLSNIVDRYKMKNSGLLYGKVGSMLGTFILILLALSGYRILNTHAISLAIAYIIITFALFMSFVKLSKIFTHFRGVAVVLSFVIAAMMWIIYALKMCDVQEVYVIYMMLDYFITFPFIGFLGLSVVIAFGVYTAKPRGELLSVIDVRDLVAEPKAAPQKETKPETVAAGDTDAGNDDIRQKMMGYSDEQLRKIVDRPTFYKADVVKEAEKILKRRKAWDKIKDLPDDELLEITMSDSSLFDEDVVEAASMELYSRGSELLRQQFLSLTPDIVASIANGTAPAPEGIRLAAKAFLNKNTQP